MSVQCKNEILRLHAGPLLLISRSSLGNCTQAMVKVIKRKMNHAGSDFQH